VVIISNPSAARSRRRVEALRQALPDSATLSHCVTVQSAELAKLVGHDQWQPADLLVVNGGDGSVQHVLTELLNNCPAARLPRVACLPGGSTNMTAFDINAHRSFQRCLATLGIVAAGTPDPAATAAGTRPVVRVVAEGSDGRARYGLFFGIGTIVQGIEFFHQRVRPSGGVHELGAGVAMARAVWGIMRRQPPFAEPLRVAIGESRSGAARECAAGADGEEWQTLAVRLLLVTALDRLFLGMRPYWGHAQDGDGGLKTTLVESRARRFLLSLPRLLSGRPGNGMTPEHGYRSGRTEHLRLRFDGSFTLDGELFANRGATMTVQSSVPVRFVPL
jgi:diacylglycerol kinase (ATP)